MNKLFLLLAGLALLPLSSSAQEAAPSANATTITSDQLKLDMGKKQGTFVGNVLVVGPDFRMKSGEMTVFFSEKDNSVERLVAKGNVEIEQTERLARSTQLEYIVAQDKMILTGSPEVVQGRNRITGTTINIYRGSNRMEVDGRSRVLIYDNLGGNK
jgi:lipopolysaccharide export system protein LptA